MFKSTGNIIYNPRRPGMKRNTDWWVIITADNEITRYYRWWIYNRYWIELDKPSWGAHISVLRGEKPRPQHMHLWKKYHGKKVTFWYDHDVKHAGHRKGFYVIEVKCPMIQQIRNEFGFRSNWNGHMTIGRLKNA